MRLMLMGIGNAVGHFSELYNKYFAVFSSARTTTDRPQYLYDCSVMPVAYILAHFLTSIISLIVLV